MKQTKQFRGSSIGYHGQVTIQLKAGNELITQHTSHNAGLPPLFKGLCAALGGDPISRVRPKTIGLFTATDTALSIIDDYKEAAWSSLFTDNILQFASSFFPIESIETQLEESPAVIFKARVPVSFIESNSIYALALFPEAALTAEHALTCYKLLSADKSVWEPIKLNSASLNDSLFIEWKVTFDNMN